MTVESTLERLSGSLPEWNHKGLNEAQTSQVIVLRVFQALGFDIWNPFEVVAQLHSGGGGGAYAPDFAVHLNSTYFVVEVKALDKDFSPNDRMQPVNYVNALGRRWAVLTNGKVWHFYDNRIDKPAAEKLALTVDLQDPRAANYLTRLLSREVWLKADVEHTLAAEVQAIRAEIRRHLELSEIEKKLRRELEAGFTKDERGLTRAVQLTLEPNERELAEESFHELALRLGIATEPLKPTDPKPEPAQPKSDVTEPKDIFAAIVEGMHKTAPARRASRSSELQAWLDDVELPAANWRDINAGIVEAMMTLGQKSFVSSRGYIYPTDKARAKGDGKLYPKSAYRQLSDGDFLFLHDSANNHLQRSRRMLGELGVPPRTLLIRYRNETFNLP